MTEDERPADPAADMLGISAFEFEDLSPAALRLVRLLLRSQGIAHSKLKPLFSASTSEEASSDLDSVLQELHQSGALIVDDAQDDPVYRLQLRRKQRGQVQALWDAVDTPQPTQRTQPQRLLDSLDLEQLPHRRHQPNLRPRPHQDADQDQPAADDTSSQAS